MIAIPAIDLRDGACVQLVGGDYAAEKVRLDDPPAVARGFARAGFRRLHVVDLDAATGRGSNRDVIARLLAAHALQGKMICKRELAETAIHVERDMLKENVGVQDQIETAHGGLNKILIERDGSFTLEPVIAPKPRIARFHEHLMLFFTGISRNASEIAGEQIASIGKKQSELHAMRALVDEGERILSGTGDLADFGRLLHDTWRLKRGLSARIAPAVVDEVYAKARKAGAIGGKLLGAGGGGFMLFFAAPDHQPSVRAALSGLVQVPFAFETGGAQLIYYDAADVAPTVHARADRLRA